MGFIKSNDNQIIGRCNRPIFAKEGKTLPIELASDETLTDINSGLRLIQKSDGLTFGSDAYLLSAYVRRQTKARAVDLGSGTGIIPMLLLANRKVASCFAVEIQPEFAEIIVRNAELNNLSDRIFPICTDIRRLTVGELGGTVDIVVSNPPYMKTAGKQNESRFKTIARHEHFGDIADFCRAASGILKFGGLFYTVYRPDRSCDLIAALRDSGLEPKRMTFVHSREDSEPCLLLCESKKGASPGVYVTPPLIMYRQGCEYTENLTAIYEKGDFNEHYKRP